MKNHAMLAPAITLLCLLSPTSLLASDSVKPLEVEQPRWFEIEIILFKHASVKGSNNETFSARDLTAKKRYALDLLAPYLQPDIASLKQLLPTCGQPNTQLPYHVTPTPIELLSKDVKQAVISQELAGNIYSHSAIDDVSLTQSNPNSNSDSNKDRKNNNTGSSAMSVTFTAPTQSNAIEESKSIAIPTKVALATEKRINKQYANIELPTYNQYPSDSNTPLCVIPADYFENNLSVEQLKYFSIDGFPVEKVANTINGMEQWRDDEEGEITWASNKPYLISQDSLRLKSIANRIKRSRNYKPLLHLGWRQIGENRRQAKAVNLYAGNNLELGYQNALAEQAKQQSTLAIESILEKRLQAEELISQHVATSNVEQSDSTTNNNVVISDKNALTSNESNINTDELSDSDMSVEQISVDNMPIDELSITEELQQQAKQKQLEKLFQDFEQFNTAKSTDISQGMNSNTINDSELQTLMGEAEIKQIVAALSTDITEHTSLELTQNNALDKPTAITAPLQPWSLDGLFKVHLEHYLYIKTELNLIEPSKVIGDAKKQTLSHDQANKKSQLSEVISFKQDRRVISGEIHYFDHPHIGMVVQIRRFDPTKPAAEAVSQSKNQ